MYAAFEMCRIRIDLFLLVVNTRTHQLHQCLSSERCAELVGQDESTFYNNACCCCAYHNEHIDLETQIEKRFQNFIEPIDLYLFDVAFLLVSTLHEPESKWFHIITKRICIAD